MSVRLCSKTFLRFAFLLVFLRFFAPAPAYATPVEGAQRVIAIIKQVRVYAERSERANAVEQARLKHLLESAAENIPEFFQYGYGPGLLQLDGFREDLYLLVGYLHASEQREEAHFRLKEIGFDRFAMTLAEASEASVEPAMESIQKLQTATERTFEAQEDFAVRAAKKVKHLWYRHAGAVLTLSFALVLRFQDELQIGTMTPREFIAFLGGIWGAAAGSYWLIWDYFKWIDPYLKWALGEDYGELVKAWSDFSSFYPQISSRTVGAAASDKLISETTHADVFSDAALEALLLNKDERVKPQLFQLFIKSLKAGKSRRAMRILNELRDRDPTSEHTQLCEAVHDFFAIRSWIEWKGYLWQAAKATVRISILTLGIWAFNAAVKWVAPESIARWRSVPTAILGAVGARRLVSVFWGASQKEAIPKRTEKDLKNLLAAATRIMKLDPSGDILSSIAGYDSGAASQQIITRTTADALALKPSGEVTMNLFRLLREELARVQVSNERIRYLSDATFIQHRSCLSRIAGLTADLRKAFREPQAEVAPEMEKASLDAFSLAP